jgi:hypothetical protein
MLRPTSVDWLVDDSESELLSVLVTVEENPVSIHVPPWMQGKNELTPGFPPGFVASTAAPIATGWSEPVLQIKCLAFPSEIRATQGLAGAGGCGLA